MEFQFSLLFACSKDSNAESNNNYFQGDYEYILTGKGSFFSKLIYLKFYVDVYDYCHDRRNLIQIANALVPINTWRVTPLAQRHIFAAITARRDSVFCDSQPALRTIEGNGANSLRF